MKVLLTGGTGFIGRVVVSELVRRGHEVLVVARNVDVAMPAGARHIPGDISEASSLHGPFVDVDAVVHLVGIIREVGTATFQRVHVDGTQNVVDAMEQADVRRIVYVSAIGASPDGVSRYQTTKFEAEEIIRRSGLDYVILRPSLVFGPGDEFTASLTDLVRQIGPTPVVGDGKSRFQPIAVENVVSCIVESLENDEHTGKTYELGGPDVLTFEQMVGMVSVALGVHKSILHVPRWAVKAGVATLEKITSRLPVTSDQLAMLQRDNVCSHNDAQEVFSLHLTRFRDALPTMVAAAKEPTHSA